jgi:uroporphyrin-3 C-methyltransferase
MTDKNQLPDVLPLPEGVPAAADTNSLPSAGLTARARETAALEQDFTGSGGIPPDPAPSSNRSVAVAVAKPRPNFAWLAIALVLLCVALAAALWWQRQAADQFGMAVATRLDALSSELSQLRRDAREALALAQSQVGRLTALEITVRESQAEYSALEQAWQDFNETTNDGVLVNDVERLVTIASQQLRFGGSVSNAIVALEAAQSRLARADRPRLAPVQQAINGDLERLRAVPVVDVAAQTARIDRLAVLVSRAPLLVPDTHARPSGPAATPPVALAQPHESAATGVFTGLGETPWWQRWWAEVASWPARAGGVLAHEMGDLIRIQRVSQPEALLLSSDQAGQLRAVLRQRLQTAQLALLMRQAPVWQSELTAVSLALNDYFDPQSLDTRAALRMVESLAEAQVAISLPDLNNSLDAMAAVRTEPTLEIERN